MGIILTNEALSHFYGGGLLVKNYSKTGSYVFKGPIEWVFINKPDTMQIELEWFAKGETFPPIPKFWKNVKSTVYELDLRVHKQENPSRGCFMLTHRVVNEIVMLFTPEVLKSNLSLDKLVVRGL